MPGPAGRARRLLAAGALAAVALLTGCTDDGGPEGRPNASGSPDDSGGQTSSEPSAAGPGEQAAAFPVPAAAQPVPLPNLGTREASDLTYTLNAVRRVSPEAVSVEGTLMAKGNTPLIDFAEPGFKVRDVDGTTPFTYEISAVTLAAPGDPKVYLPLRDEKGFCACSQGILGIDRGQSMGVYTYVTAPAGAQTVSVTVSPFGVFQNVPVTS